MKENIDFVKEQVAASVRVKEAFLADEKALEKVAELADLLVKTYRQGGKTLWAGNGGSAADAQHMAAELVNKYRLTRSGIPAMALTVDTSITATGRCPTVSSSPAAVRAMSLWDCPLPGIRKTWCGPWMPAGRRES